MLIVNRDADARTLKRAARNIELQAGRSSPLLASQLRALAAQYRARAEALADANGAARQHAWRFDRRPRQAPGPTLPEPS